MFAAPPICLNWKKKQFSERRSDLLPPVWENGGTKEEAKRERAETKKNSFFFFFWTGDGEADSGCRLGNSGHVLDTPPEAERGIRRGRTGEGSESTSIVERDDQQTFTSVAVCNITLT